MNKPTASSKAHPFISIIRVICFIAVLSLVLAKVYSVLSWKDTSGDYLSSIEQLYSTDDNLIDVVFVGSSHVYCGIYPSILWSEHGVSAFDLSISGQDINSSYHSIVELLKTQSPKVVFVDIYGVLYDGYNNTGNLYRNALSLRPSINSYNLITDLVGKDEAMSYSTKFPVIHTRYTELKRFDFQTNPVNIYSRGEVFYMCIAEQSPDNFNTSEITEIGELNDTNKAWIDDLILLSKENNFKLIFFVAPTRMTDSHQVQLNAATAYATEQGIACYDFNRYPELLNIDLNTDFKDYAHLNYNGARKLTSWFGTWLCENTTIIDHRGDDSYYQWNMDAHLYKNNLDKANMDLCNGLIESLPIAASNSDFITVLSLNFYSTDHIDEQYIDILNYACIDAEEAFRGGMWICKNGVFTKVISNDPNDLAYYEKLPSSEILRLHYDSSPYAATNISIGHTNYNTFGTYATVIVYDTYTQQVIYHGGQ
ncbi:MAG: hypothetical protein MJ130_10460 [Lachnospiraceae bacterium]|nr:hypothetical protein [Lachnospiraceae bacterium]